LEMIIGITGTLGAGKGTIVKFLKEKGFAHFSVRDFLTEEILRRGLNVNRDNMISVANDLRTSFGASYIVEELFVRAAKTGGDAVIESIRCVGEVEALRNKEDFVFWAVDADVESRYTRITERKSSTDRVSFQDFVRQEESEMENDDPLKQNLKVCIGMADFCFRNDWTKVELEGKVEKVLGETGKAEEKSEHVRPSWDEYFMEICRAVAKRATCDRGRSGCVIARDKQILVTGYVGSPVGLPHCDEVGHQFEDTIHEDGVKRSHCVRTTHAEQNAICQAAKIGVSINGATLYCKMEPCPVCAKMIINSGIKRVVCEKRYQSGAQSLLEEAGVKVEVLVDEVEKY
jgi:dCMP deaminase